MVCIHCGHDTKVTNSRFQKRDNQVWRRRKCVNCQAIFTTEEAVQLELSWVVLDSNGAFTPFSRDKLFLSLYASLQHRQNPSEDAAGLTKTIINKLAGQLTDASLTKQGIKQVSLVALNRFDKVASTYYNAFHK